MIANEPMLNRIEQNDVGVEIYGLQFIGEMLRLQFIGPLHGNQGSRESSPFLAG